MCAFCTLTHSIWLQGLSMSSILCSSIKAKFLPFARVERVKSNESNSLQLACDLDTNAQKINLAGEVFRNGDGTPHVFQAELKA
ncbi:GH17075 [Drosophila grimshawi]|uniref:GH17075 n=1 Tax=Drosophila grimshawi TaxID=7222 RepID=B4J015_DROGR|nr:GH17075 [Drosophila grimshawi]